MITIEDVRQAAAHIPGFESTARLVTSHLVDRRAGVSCFFKCANFQRGGAFKIRGAANFLLSIPKQDIRSRCGCILFREPRAGGRFAAPRPSGFRDDCDANGCPAAKLEATRNYGAKVVQYDRLTEDRQAIGERIAMETGARLCRLRIMPPDHDRTGTAALELLEEVPDLRALAILPRWRSGLFSGCSVVAHGIDPEIRPVRCRTGEG